MENQSKPKSQVYTIQISHPVTGSGITGSTHVIRAESQLDALRRLVKIEEAKESRRQVEEARKAPTKPDLGSLGKRLGFKPMRTKTYGYNEQEHR